jgi:hypothetical protein
LGAVVRSQVRRRAERARGLSSASSSSANRALRSIGTHTAWIRSPACSANRGGSELSHARSRNRRLTRRSSSEWKLMIAQRPPGASRSGTPVEERGQLVELAVDRDAQALERAGRRVDVQLAQVAGREAARDHAGQRDVVEVSVPRRARPP